MVETRAQKRIRLNHQHNVGVHQGEGQQANLQPAPFPLLSLPHHIICSHILPRVKDPACVGRFLSTSQPAHSLHSTHLQANWLQQQRPATALYLSAHRQSGSEALMLELLDRPGVLAVNGAAVDLCNNKRKQVGLTQQCVNKSSCLLSSSSSTFCQAPSPLPQITLVFCTKSSSTTTIVLHLFKLNLCLESRSSSALQQPWFRPLHLHLRQSLSLSGCFSSSHPFHLTRCAGRYCCGRQQPRCIRAALGNLLWICSSSAQAATTGRRPKCRRRARDHTVDGSCAI